MLRKQCLWEIFFIAFGIAVAFMVSEASFRIYGAIKGVDFRLYSKELINSDRLPKGLFKTTESHRRVLNPGHQVLATTSDFSVLYSINQKGTRGPEYSYSRIRGKYRIVAMGDSFTFGEGIPYGSRFTDIVEKRIDHIEIVNMGVPGYGVDESLVLFSTEGIKYQPDEVMLFVSGASTERKNLPIVQSGEVDLENKFLEGNHISGARSIYLENSAPFYHQKSYWFSRHSQLWAYLNYVVQLQGLRSQFAKADESLWNAIRISRALKSTRLSEDDPSVQARTLALLKALRRICERKKIRLTIVNIDIENKLSYINQLEGLEFFDLSTLLTEESKKYSLQFVYDPHFNPKTQVFIGERLVGILRNR